MFLESRNLFSDNCCFRSIATGINAGSIVNVDTAKEVGEKTLTSMAQQKVLQLSFKKKYQAVTLSTSVVRVNNETIQIDPHLLFQRLVTAGTRNDQLEEIVQFEICCYTPAIFEARYVMRPANNPALADDILALLPSDVDGPTGQTQMYWMVSAWCTECHGGGYNLQCTQGTSPDIMDMPLLCSTGTRKNHPRNMVRTNAAQVEEQAQQWISHGEWSWSLKKNTSYTTRTTSSDSLGC